MNGPSVRGSVFEGTLQAWRTSPGPMFEGDGIGPNSRLKLFPDEDEYDYSRDVAYDYSTGNETLRFKDPAVYSDGTNTLTPVMNRDGLSGIFNKDLMFGSVSQDANHTFVLYKGKDATPIPSFVVDKDLTISKIITNEATYTWVESSKGVSQSGGIRFKDPAVYSDGTKILNPVMNEDGMSGSFNKDIRFGSLSKDGKYTFIMYKSTDSSPLMRFSVDKDFTISKIVIGDSIYTWTSSKSTDYNLKSNKEWFWSFF